MRAIHRRDFLHDWAALAATLAGAGLAGNARSEGEAKPARKTGANDQLRVALVGVHGQGLGHVHGYAGKHGCVVATICDCDEAVVGRAMTDAEKAQGKVPRYEKDLRAAKPASGLAGELGGW
jgi:hypothetical protein